jgi:WD40 repeat protein
VLATWGQYLKRDPRDYHTTVQLWDVRSGKEVRRLKVPGYLITAAALSPDGKRLVAAELVSTLSVWDVGTGKEVSRLAARPGTALLRYSPDGRLLAAGTHDGVAQLWEAGTGKRLGLSRVRDCRLGSLAFRPGRKVLAAGITAQSVCVWELPAGRDLTPRDAHPGTISAIAFSRDGKAVISAGADGVRVWEAATGRGLRHILPPGEEERRRHGTGGGRTQCLLSPGGRYLVCGMLPSDGMQVVDLAGGEYVGGLLEWAKNRVVTALAFSPDGRTLAAGTSAPDREEFPLVLWELASGRVRAEFKGHRGPVNVLAFAPDGRSLATGSADTTVLLWDLTGRPDPAVRLLGKRSSEQLAGLWSDLGSGDARKGHQAMVRLAAAPTEAVALLRQRVKPDARKPLAVAEVRRLIAELEDDSFAVREEASRALEGAGRSVLPVLHKALEAEPGPEKKSRLQRLLQGMRTASPAPELVRSVRAVELLERLGTPEARRLLEALAGGQPDARLTADARAALGRLSRLP